MLDLNEIPNIPRDSEGPIFPSPWAARAFALTVQLAKSGLFTWSEWVALFSAEIALEDTTTHAHALTEDHTGYYTCWVSALEKMLAGKGILNEASLRTSFETTLANWPEPDPVAKLEPIARSPARD